MLINEYNIIIFIMKQKCPRCGERKDMFAASMELMKLVCEPCFIEEERETDAKIEDMPCWMEREE